MKISFITILMLLFCGTLVMGQDQVRIRRVASRNG